MGGTGQPAGGIPNEHIVLPFPGGSLAYFQVKAWDSAYANAEAALAAGTYSGENNIFTMTPSASITYAPIISGGGSTWTAVGNESPLIVGGGGPPDYVYIISRPVSQRVPQGRGVGFRLRRVVPTVAH